MARRRIRVRCAVPVLLALLASPASGNSLEEGQSAFGKGLCSAESSQPARPDLEISTVRSIGDRELDILEAGGVVGGKSLREGMGELGLDLSDFDQRFAMTVTVARTFKHSLFTLSRGGGSTGDSVILYSVVPDEVRAALAAEGVEIPWSGFVVRSSHEAPPEVRVLGIAGRFRYEPGQGFQYATDPGSQDSVNKGFGDCVDCILDFLSSLTCEAFSVAVLCGPPPTWVTTCPGKILDMLIKNIGSIIFSTACGNSLTGLSCAQCFIPTITLTPGSNANLTSGINRVRVTISGGLQASNWVAIFRNGSADPVMVDAGLGSDDTYDWNASSGTYTILGGNIPLTASLPWLQRSTNVVVGSPSGSCQSTISAGQAVASSWSSGCDSVHRSGRYARYYSFTLGATTQVTIDLVSSSADPYLYLLNGGASTGTVLTSDDDSGEGSNSRITRTLAPGTYNIEATTFQSATTGSFQLRLSTSGTACQQTVSLPVGLSSSWSSSCTSVRRAGSYARYYTFTVPSTRTVTISLNSSTDTYLNLLSGSSPSGSLVASDDDSGEGSNSRIVRTLSSGTYTIEATTFRSGDLGSFSLQVN